MKSSRKCCLVQEVHGACYTKICGATVKIVNVLQKHVTHRVALPVAESIFV